MPRSALVIIAVVCACGIARAQSREDRAYVSETLLAGSARGSSTEIAVGTPPFHLVGPLSIGAGVYGRRTWLQGSDPHDGGTFVGSDAQFSLLFLAPLSERWVVTVVPVVAGRFTDDADFRVPRDLTFAGVALASYAIGGNRDFVVSMGLLFTNTLPVSPVIPIGGLRYADASWRVELLWPQPQAVYKFGDRVEAGIAMRFDYPLYRMQNLAVSDGIAEYARLTNHHFGGVVAARLVANLWLAAKPGVNVGRVVRLVDGDRDNLDGGRQDLDIAPALTFILSWRMGRR